MTDYFLAFGTTIVVELAVSLLFVRSWKMLLAVLLVNLVTHPLFGAILYFFPNVRGVPSVPLMEGVIVIVEALLLILAFPEKKKWLLFALSLCMNGASYVAGALYFGNWG